MDPGDAASVLTGGMVNQATKDVTDKAIKEVGHALRNIGDEVERFGKNVGAEVKRAERQVATAVEATAEYVEEKTKKTLEVPQETLDHVREGKIVDAIWRLSTADIRIENDAASKAALKSDLIRTVGQVAASVYGGPQGAAAYAAWLTYNQTNGDINLALKVGVITGVSAYALQSAGTIPTTDAAGAIVPAEVAKKAAVNGALGGLAVAAAGGDEAAVKEGFLRAGAMVLIQEGYRSYTSHGLENDTLKSSNGSPYCISTVVDCQRPPPEAAVYDENGNFKGWNQKMLNNRAPRVGLGYPDEPIDTAGTVSEGAPVMAALSKVPGMNAMAIFHDQWAMEWNMPPGVLQGTIYPAIVMTYNGTTAPLFEQVREVAVSERVSAEEMEGATSIVAVADDQVPASSPVEEARVETGYLCAKDGQSRSILVEVDTKKEQFACRVLYRSDGVREVPWIAYHQTDYCEPMAKQLADQHLRWGYACVVGNATQRSGSK